MESNPRRAPQQRPTEGFEECGSEIHRCGKHVHVFTIQDGFITEHQAVRDDLALLLQLGAISPPA
jgi:hypothetical protein